MKLKNFNIADYFSIYRLVTAPLIILAIVFDSRIITSILLLVSFLTDAVDGYLARSRKIETSKGAKLDSIGDLVTLILGLAAFVSFETEFVLDHLPIIITAVTLFIFQMIVSLIRFRKVSSYHTYLAKITAVLIAAFFVVTPVAGPFELLFYVAFYSGIGEAAEEIIITLVLRKPAENVKGLYWVLKRPDLRFTLH